MGPAAPDTMQHNLAELLPPATCWAFGATEDLARSVAERESRACPCTVYKLTKK